MLLRYNFNLAKTELNPYIKLKSFFFQKTWDSASSKRSNAAQSLIIATENAMMKCNDSPGWLCCVKYRNFHLISWCGNSGDSLETMRKLCLSTKFSHQKIRWNYGIFCSAMSHIFIKSYTITEKQKLLLLIRIKQLLLVSLPKIWSCPLRISSVNVTKSVLCNIFWFCLVK